MWGLQSPLVRVQCTYVLCPMILCMEKDSTLATSLALAMVHKLSGPGGGGGGGRGTQQSVIRGGSTPRSNRQPFYIHLAEKIPLLYTFY